MRPRLSRLISSTPFMAMTHTDQVVCVRLGDVDWALSRAGLAALGVAAADGRVGDFRDARYDMVETSYM